MDPVNAILADLIIGRAVDLERYSASVRSRVRFLLNVLRGDLERELLTAGLDDVQRSSTRITRSQALLRAVDRTLEGTFGEIEGYATDRLVKLAGNEQKFVAGQINTVLQVDLASPGLDPQELETLVNKTFIYGASAKSWWLKQTRDTQSRFAQQIRLGVVAGENTGQLLQRVRGTFVGYTSGTNEDGRTVRIPRFENGVLPVSTKEAEGLIRTSVHGIAQQSRLETLRANDDVVKGYAALVTLDSRTSALCISRSGGAWDLKGNPLPESRVKMKFPGPPPWHFRCRTQLVPVLKSWADLVEDPAMKKKLEKVKPSVGMQASMDGQVPADLNYEDWLRTKSEEFQKDILGPGRWKLWKAGKLSLSELTDMTGRPLRLEELR